MTDLNSRPYKPDPAKCCEACIFGSGEHAEWCPDELFSRPMTPLGKPLGVELADEWTIRDILASAGL